jgi:cytoskeleton protein RodZ
LFEIGASLAAARKGQSLTLADAERLTLLRGKYLQALEADDFGVLPGRTYARAFLRTYADALGLDSDQFVDEFDARYADTDEESPVPLFSPRRRRRAGPRLVFGLIVAAALVGALLWSTLTPNGKVTPPAQPPAAHAAPAHPRVALALPHKPVPRPALVIRATTGPCWLLVRRGGPAGAVLYEGTLEQGNAKRFAPRVWVRLGAPWNVTVRRGAHVVSSAPPSNPVNLTA